MTKDEQKDIVKALTTMRNCESMLTMLGGIIQRLRESKGVYEDCLRDEEDTELEDAPLTAQEMLRIMQILGFAEIVLLTDAIDSVRATRMVLGIQHVLDALQDDDE